MLPFSPLIGQSILYEHYCLRKFILHSHTHFFLAVRKNIIQNMLTLKWSLNSCYISCKYFWVHEERNHNHFCSDKLYIIKRLHRHNKNTSKDFYTIILLPIFFITEICEGYICCCCDDRMEHKWNIDLIVSINYGFYAVYLWRVLGLCSNSEYHFKKQILQWL